ncbi:MAG TPA: acyl carrier protein [Ilumatobacteraceae bacterium]|nr:acyl carrier protein [Ilumatobacteraceae bacterium]
MTITDPHDLLARLLRRIAPEVDLAEIDPDVPLQDAADLDSMDFLNLVNALHDETGIDVPERDYPAISSISGFTEYVVAAAGSHTPP